MPPTPTLSAEASVLVTNADLHVSFRHPEGWTLIDSGTLPFGPQPPKYATYGLKNQPTAPAFRIEKPAFGMELSQDQMVYFAVQGGRSRDFIAEELRETIQGMPAGGARLVGKKQVHFALIVTPPGQHYAFFWSSDLEYFSQLEGIYRAMVPTIKIEPPAP